MLVTEAGQSFPVGPTEQEVKEQKEEKKKTFVCSCYRLCSIVPEHTSIYNIEKSLARTRLRDSTEQ
jgi:hypothetical protein